MSMSLLAVQPRPASGAVDSLGTMDEMSGFRLGNARRSRGPARFALTAATVIGACGPRTAQESPSAPSRIVAEPAARIVVLGDSLSVSPSLDQSFPAHLQARLDKQGLRWTITNAGVSGDTTAGGLRRVERLLANDVRILVVALGANDGLRGIDTMTIEANLSTIIETAQQRSVRVLLCGMETFPRHGWDYTVAFHNVFPKLARRYDVTLVPFLLAGVALVPDMNGADGVHPNAAGAQRIAETIWPYLESLLTAESMPVAVTREFSVAAGA